MRWHLHVPVNAFFVAVTLLQNSYVCRAAWPEVPGALPAALSPGESGSIHCPLRLSALTVGAEAPALNNVLACCASTAPLRRSFNMHGHNSIPA